MHSITNYLKKDFAIYLILLFIGLNSLTILFETNVIEIVEFIILWLAQGSLFLILYVIRFKRKNTVATSDYLKLVIMVVTPFVPIINLYALYSNEFLVTISVAYFVLLISIYYYEFILTSMTMKRNFIIAFIIQSLVVAMCIVYAYVQTIIAKEQAREADAQRMLADEQRQMAEKARAKAEKNYMEIRKLKTSLDSLKIKARN